VLDVYICILYFSHMLGGFLHICTYTCTIYCGLWPLDNTSCIFLTASSPANANAEEPETPRQIPLLAQTLRSHYSRTTCAALSSPDKKPRLVVFLAGAVVAAAPVCSRAFAPPRPDGFPTCRRLFVRSLPPHADEERGPCTGGRFLSVRPPP
jgi:hypothetical protein